MRLLRLAHRVIGLALAIPIVLVSLSGGLLLLRDPYYRARFPVLAVEMTAEQRAARAEVLTRIDTRFRPAAVRVVKFPRPGMNAFHVYLDDRSEAFVHPLTGDVISRWRWSTSPPAFLFDLHAHLLMGGTGETLNGYAALALVFLGLTGIVLWWPRRVAFGATRPFPRRWSPGEVLRAHSASGILLVVPVLLFSATGAAIVFYEPASTVMTAMLDSHPAAAPAGAVQRVDAATRPWADILETVDATLPDAGPAMYSPGSSSNAVLTFRKSLPGEWHPNGRSYVLVNPYDATVVQAIDARAQGAGTRTMHAVYPIHAAKVGGVVLIPLAALAAAGLAWLAFGGTWSYLARFALSRRTASRRSGADYRLRDGAPIAQAPAGRAAE